MKIIFFILTLFSFNIFADDHDDVLAAVEKYYEAREVRDFKTMVATRAKWAYVVLIQMVVFIKLA